MNYSEHKLLIHEEIELIKKLIRSSKDTGKKVTDGNYVVDSLNNIIIRNGIDTIFIKEFELAIYFYTTMSTSVASGNCIMDKEGLYYKQLNNNKKNIGRDSDNKSINLNNIKTNNSIENKKELNNNSFKHSDSKSDEPISLNNVFIANCVTIGPDGMPKIERVVKQL